MTIVLVQYWMASSRAWLNHSIWLSLSNKHTISASHFWVMAHFELSDGDNLYLFNSLMNKTSTRILWDLVRRRTLFILKIIKFEIIFFKILTLLLFCYFIDFEIGFEILSDFIMKFKKTDAWNCFFFLLNSYTSVFLSYYLPDRRAQEKDWSRLVLPHLPYNLRRALR